MFNKCYFLVHLELPDIDENIDVSYMFSDCGEELRRMIRFFRNLNENAYKDESNDLPAKYDYEDVFVH